MCLLRKSATIEDIKNLGNLQIHNKASHHYMMPIAINHISYFPTKFSHYFSQFYIKPINYSKSYSSLESRHFKGWLNRIARYEKSRTHSKPQWICPFNGNYPQHTIAWAWCYQSVKSKFEEIYYNKKQTLKMYMDWMTTGLL